MQLKHFQTLKMNSQLSNYQTQDRLRLELETGKCKNF